MRPEEYEDWRPVNEYVLFRLRLYADGYWITQASTRDPCGSFPTDNMLTMLSVYEAEARRRNEAAAKKKVEGN